MLPRARGSCGWILELYLFSMIGVGSEPREGYRAGNGAITGNQVLIRMSNLDVFYLTKPTLTRLLLCCCTSFPIQSSLEILVKKKKKKRYLPNKVWFCSWYFSTASRHLCCEASSHLDFHWMLEEKNKHVNLHRCPWRSVYLLRPAFPQEHLLETAVAVGSLISLISRAILPSWSICICLLNS